MIIVKLSDNLLIFWEFSDNLTGVNYLKISQHWLNYLTIYNPHAGRWTSAWSCREYLIKVC